MISFGSSAASKPLLAVNCAEDRVQLVLGQEGEILFGQDIQGGGRAVQILPQALASCFQHTGHHPGEIGGVACVLGPGTFTGLRVSIAVVIGLARGAGIPLAGLEYLPLLAAGPARCATGEIWVCTQARKGLVYVQGFSSVDAQPVMGVQASLLEEAAGLIQKRERSVCLIGSAISMNEDFWSQRLPGSSREDKRWNRPSLADLLHRAEGAKYSSEPLRPLYLRPADAEVNIPGIAARRGLSKEDFTKRIPDF